MLFAVSPKISLTRQRYTVASPKVRSQRVIEVRPQKQDRINSGSVHTVDNESPIPNDRQRVTTINNSNSNSISNISIISSSNSSSNNNNSNNNSKRRQSINTRLSFVNENTIRTLVLEMSTRQAPETAYIPPTTAFVAATNPRRVKMGSFLVGRSVAHITFTLKTLLQNDITPYIYSYIHTYIQTSVVPQPSTALSHIYSPDIPVDPTASRTLSPEFDALYNQYMVSRILVCIQ